MPFESQFSLSLELAKILPVREVVNAGAEKIISLVRALKREGSDFLIEEDLANIFGRGKIEPSLEDDFRRVVKIGSIQLLHVDCHIVLDSNPGATVRRALKDRFYMSSVIQLSFLTWMHEETTLAEALTESMRSRYESKVQGATPDPDYEGVLKTLRACSSQTSQYRWDDLCALVENCFKKSRQWFCALRSPLKHLSSNLLLGAMDYLYMVQTLPEDRLLRVDGQTGLVPIVIWAHYILGLNVLVESSPDGDVVFGQVERPQVIIKWNSTLSIQHGQVSSGLDHSTKVPPPDIYLLDAGMHVILKTEPEVDKMIEIKGQECCRLKGYSTIYLQRFFNEQRLLADDDPVYADTANFTVSITLLVSSAARYREPCYGEGETLRKTRDFNTELWRLFDSSLLFFSGIELDKHQIFEQLDKIRGKSFNEMAVPTSVRNFLEPLKNKNRFFRIVKDLAILTFFFGQVIDIKSCSDLPLLYRESPLWEDQLEFDGTSSLFLQPISCFDYIKDMMEDAAKGIWNTESESCVLTCHHGWSLFLSSVGDCDPQDFNCQLLCIKRGVPTNTRTNERKYRISSPSFLNLGNTRDVVLDKGDSYVPRCVTKVLKRTEQYSSRSDEFRLSVRFEVEQLEFEQQNLDQRSRERSFQSLFASYSTLQNSLWNLYKTEPCTHQIEDGKSLPLDLDVQTVGAPHNFTSPGQVTRILISLVKGDPRARWLAVYSCAGYATVYRQIMLRCNGCCEDCAVKTASAIKGEWLVIL